MEINLVGKAVRRISLPTVDYNASPIVVVPAQQNDVKSRFIEVALFDDRGTIDVTTYAGAMLNAVTPDQVLMYVDCTIVTADNVDNGQRKNTILVEIGGSLLKTEGRIPCEISLYNEDKSMWLTSKTFYIVVYKSQAGDSAVESLPEYTILQKLLQEVQAIVKEEQVRVEAEAKRVSAEQSRVSAEAGRVASETTRKENEAARVNAEGLRASAETERESSEEERKAAESGRVEAEEERKKNMPRIGEDGYWYLGDENTGVNCTGADLYSFKVESGNLILVKEKAASENVQYRIDENGDLILNLN